MNTTKKIILVPTDFSEQSLVALKQARNMAWLMNGELFILHVSEEQGIISSIFSREDQDKHLQETWEKINELSKEIEAESTVKVTSLVARGKIYEEIVHVAELIGASFIIMGTNGSAKVRSRFIGSNALRVVRESRVPVISIKGHPAREGFGTIVLPLDLTKETREKVNKAIELSRTFQAKVKVVSIILTDDEEVVHKLQLQLNQVHNFLNQAGVENTAELVNVSKSGGSLGDEVIAYANSVQGDLIMIMTQQETNFTELFIGSAAQEVINNSEIPVCSIIPTVKNDTTVFTPY